MQKESTIQPDAPAGEETRSQCDLPEELCDVLTQIMLYVTKMDEEYLKHKEGEQER